MDNGKKFYFWRTLATQILGGSFVLCAFGYVWQNVPSISFVDRAIATVSGEAPKIREEMKAGDDAVKTSLLAEMDKRAAVRDGRENVAVTRIDNLEKRMDRGFEDIKTLIKEERQKRKGIAFRRPGAPPWFAQPKLVSDDI